MDNGRYRKWAIQMHFVILMPKGHKIGVKSRIYYKNNSWMDWVRRTLGDEDSSTTTKHLMELIQEGKELFTLFPKRKDKINELLTGFLVSVKNLIDVYNECGKNWTHACLQEIYAATEDLIVDDVHNAKQKNDK